MWGFKFLSTIDMYYIKFTENFCVKTNLEFRTKAFYRFY